MRNRKQPSSGLLTLGLIWLLSALGDRLWFALDNSVPAWDQADYLTGALNYWRALQQPHWFSGAWWRELWLLSSKIPPLTYIATVPVHNWFGTGPDQATLVHLLFSAILLSSVYSLGTLLLRPQVGLWAAGLCVVMPALYQLRLQFLLDYPLAAGVVLSFLCLTGWRFSRFDHGTFPGKQTVQGWLWAIAFGITFGMALLLKQPALLFLLVPLVWVSVGALRDRAWGRLAQLTVALLITITVCTPWYRTNWLTVLTAGKRATADAAVLEQAPPLWSMGAWLYYWKELPSQISWPLLIIPLVGMLLSWTLMQLRDQKSHPVYTIRSIAAPASGDIPPKGYVAWDRQVWLWLCIFWLGAYCLSSLNPNKDSRYVLPYLPVTAVILAAGLVQWQGLRGRLMRWGVLGLAILLMGLNLYPLGNQPVQALVQILSPQAQQVANWATSWPHPQVIAAITGAEPYLQATLGVLPSTPEVNQHNLNYYGALADFQVYGRQVGIQPDQVWQDSRSLSWFLTKTGDQGSLPTPSKRQAQAALVAQIEGGSDFQVYQDWPLPDGSTLTLHHRRAPAIVVQPLPPDSDRPLKVTLEQVRLPQRAPPGLPLPVTYEWSGPWEQLQSGLVLLTYTATQPRSPRWFHDHAIGMGALHTPTALTDLATRPFRVVEQTAMLPPPHLPAGTYKLGAIYLNRVTGETYPLPVPPLAVTIDPTAEPTSAPELDLVTQLRMLAARLSQGPAVLEPVFAEIGRINQYDPIQDYVRQAEQALTYRLQREPQNLEHAYALGLAEVLRQDTQGAIAAFKRVVELDSHNPFAYAYLAFVHLYNWEPGSAQAALRRARELNADSPEIEALSAVAALMRGNLLQVWQSAQALGRL